MELFCLQCWHKKCTIQQACNIAYQIQRTQALTYTNKKEHENTIHHHPPSKQPSHQRMTVRSSENHILLSSNRMKKGVQEPPVVATKTSARCSNLICSPIPLWHEPRMLQLHRIMYSVCQPSDRVLNSHKHANKTNVYNQTRSLLWNKERHLHSIYLSIYSSNSIN